MTKHFYFDQSMQLCVNVYFQEIANIDLGLDSTQNIGYAGNDIMRRLV